MGLEDVLKHVNPKIKQDLLDAREQFVYESGVKGGNTKNAISL